MNIELNNNLENPTAFFTMNGDFVALDLVTHELRNAEQDGPIYPELHDVQPEVDQDWDNESTRFEFDGFTVVYSADQVSIEADNKLELTDTVNGWIAVYTGITGSGEYVSEEEAHNIKGNTESERVSIALGVWGAEEDNTTVKIFE